MVLKKGSRGSDVSQLQKALNALGYHCGTADGILGRATVHQIENFQENSRLFADGVVGKGTIHALNEALKDSGNSSLCFDIGDDVDPKMPSERMKWVKVPADQVDGSKGYSRFTLREDAAKAYLDLREEVLELGGVITSAGGRRRLSSSKKSASRSTKSMHYVGLAFDMALDSGMGHNPSKQPYAIESVGSRNWNVWCKTENESVPEVTIQAYKYSHTKSIVKGRYFSFTDVAKKHGFSPISARRWFMNGGKYTGAEWWHFQYNNALKEGQSTFGEELLKVYSLEECKEFIHWNNSKMCTFGVDWF